MRILGIALAAAALAALPARADQVIVDDLIVQGSQCVGLDCVNGESFGFDVVRLKENNLRLLFDDTSNSASFPRNDWQLTANDTANGGLEKFSIDDVTGGLTPLTIEAGAGNHSLYVDDSGRIGLGTSTPAVEVHSVDGDTPTLRLDQDGTDGWPVQVWDVAGNEANFFVRDATNGSLLPFKIRPGAPTDTLVVESNGDVGIGVGPAGPTPGLEVTAAGDGLFEGVSVALTHLSLSSREVKEGFEPVDGAEVLARVRELPITEWSYRERPGERHVGPVAEDFHAAFGLSDGRHIAATDATGVALAAIQGLSEALADSRAELDAVRRENERLGERLAALEAAVAERDPAR